MAFSMLVKRFKAFKVKKAVLKAQIRFITGSMVKKKKKARENKEAAQRIWTGVSHGFHKVEGLNKVDHGTVHAQREQIEGQEYWLFGTFDEQMCSGITKYLQSHLFDKNLTEGKIRRKAKKAMKDAYLSTKAKMQQEGQERDSVSGATSILVMNGESFVAASVGGYRAVLCQDGMARTLGIKNPRRLKRRWAISDIWKMNCATVNGEHNQRRGSRLVNGEHNQRRGSRLVVAAQKVEAETEFIILASEGVWEVMRSQEAVDLIAHIDDAQEAAECLAEEALHRMSKSAISCIVVRFH